VRLLEDFRQRFPQHALTAELPAKLATAYLAQQQWGAAAAEFDRLALSLPDPEARRGALWQAAELRTQAGQRTLAQQAWQRYVTLHPAPLEPAVQARQTLATLAHDSGDTRMEAAWLRAVQQADLGGGGTRTPATRTLGAMATLALAAPVLESYRQVRLVEPLQKQLALKKTRLEAALQALTQVADAGVPVAVTAAAFHSAQLYQDFGRALMTSERPKKLKAAALEQYNVMLEEQAFPFEEKAIALHETNARRAADGVYDDWVKKSFAELASLRPARYAKLERGSGNAPAPVAPTDADGWNALGIQHRQQGRFADAKAAYEQALALQPGHADALLNQAILHDLYLGDRAQALALYTRWLAQRPAGDATVARWLADLKNRKDTA
jgi:tetratricopeptide (TPR) repeat protein